MNKKERETLMKRRGFLIGLLALFGLKVPEENDNLTVNSLEKAIAEFNENGPIHARLIR